VRSDATTPSSWARSNGDPLVDDPSADGVAAATSDNVHVVRSLTMLLE